jgi:hypothetical protein
MRIVEGHDDDEEARRGAVRPPPEKWTRAAAADRVAGRSGRLLLSARDLKGLSDVAQARVQARLARRRPRATRLLLPALAVAGVVLAVSGVVAVAQGGWRRLSWSAMPAPEAPASPAPLSARTAAGRRVPGPPEAASSDIAAAAEPAVWPAALSVSRPPRRRRAQTAAAEWPAPSAEARATAMARSGQEARALVPVFAALHAGAPARALEVLQAYEQAFPAGQLRQEALVLEVEAYLALQRRGDALGLLERMALDGQPRASELHLVRAELRADVGRCASARDDLGAVAVVELAPSLRSRVEMVEARCPAIGPGSEPRQSEP